MKQKLRKHEAKGSRAQTINENTRSVTSVKQGHDSDLEKTLSLIKAHPGIRPSEINRFLKRKQSDSLRNTLIKHGVIRKEKDGTAMYPV
jgi:hypothetical protein